MSTKENLAAAFAGESQANRKYLAFAKKAEQDGYPQIAKLFRASAEAETVHALAHFKVMGGVKTTAENLQAAMDGEGYEFTNMYPGFIAEAKKEENKAAEKSFQNAMDVEKIHFKLYEEAAKSLKSGKDLPAKAIYVCDICGNTSIGNVPDTCPVCKASKEHFQEVK